VFAITAGTIHHHSLIGGQHGEEEKGKGSGKEGREEDHAPEEEVGETLLTVSTSEEVDDCLTWAGASRGAVSEPRLHSTTPARSTNEGVGYDVSLRLPTE
jgi:hypothetical protein